MIGRIERLGVVLDGVTCDLAVRVWEPPGSTRSVLCVHSFAGTGQDFETLAESLAASGLTVIAPDLIGRGESGFLGRAEAYSARAYLTCLTVASRLQKASACHLGSGWGGILLTLWLAAQRWPTRGLVLNAVPLRSGPALARARQALRAAALARFDSAEAAAAHVLAARGAGPAGAGHPPGPDPGQHQRFVDSRVMALDGAWRLRLDPAAAQDFGVEVDFDLDGPLAAAPAPVLLLQGPAGAPPAAAGLDPGINPGADPELSAQARANARLQVLTLAGGPPTPRLDSLAEVLLLGGWFARCLGAPRRG